MSFSTSLTLSHRQQCFLEKNFRVLDPETGECSLDFFNILGCKVILLGEFHHTVCLSLVQEEFFKLFARGKTVLPLEGLVPGKTLDKSKVKPFQNYPEGVELHGADMRGLTDVEAFAAYVNLKWEMAQCKVRETEALKKVTMDIAACVNNAVHVKKAVLDDQAIVVAQEVNRKVEEISELFNGEAFDEAFESMRREAAELAQKCVKHNAATTLFEESNLSLLRVIQRFTVEADVIVVKWGAAHFYGSNQLTRQMGIPGRDFIILIPSPDLEVECNLELDTLEPVDFTLTVEREISRSLGERVVDKSVSKYSIPPRFISYFHSLIRNSIVLPPRKIEMFLDEKEFANLFKESDTIVIPQNQFIHFLGVDDHIHNLLRDTKWVPENIHHLITVIDKLLLFSKFRLAKFNLGNFNVEIAADFVRSTRAITIHSQGPVELMVDRMNIRIDPASLFAEMRRRSISKYSWKAGAALMIMGMSETEARRLTTNGEEVFSWLNEKTPPQTKVRLNGRIKLDSYIYTDTVRHTGIALTAIVDSALILENDRLVRHQDFP